MKNGIAGETFNVTRISLFLQYLFNVITIFLYVIVIKLEY